MSDTRGDTCRQTAILSVVRRLRACRSEEQVASMAVRMIRSITGVERVILSVLGDDGSRRVSAQADALARRCPPDAVPHAWMSLPLRVENRLWGLITCYDRSPSAPSSRTCALSDLVAGIASIQLESVRRVARCEVGRSVGHWRARLLAHTRRGHPIGEAIRLEGRGLLALMGSSGLALLDRQEQQVPGVTSADAMLDDLTDLFTTDVGSGDTLPAERQRWLAAGLRWVVLEAEKDPQGLSALAREEASRQRMLADALADRVRDALALVRHMIGPASHGAPPGCLGEAALTSRVDILASVYEQLADADVRVGSLAEMIRAEAAAGGATEGRAPEVSGEDVELNGDALSTMTMVVHALVRDAVCATASTPARDVIEVRISRRPDAGIVVRWQAAAAPGDGRTDLNGFGAVIIERAVCVGLGGSVSVHRIAGARVVHIELPERHVAGPRPGPFQEGLVRDVVRGAAFADRSVLIAEDDVLNAVSLRDALGRLGFTVLECIGSVEEAGHYAEAGFPDCAVLDVHLGHETTFGLADRLRAGGVPFLFVAGPGEGALIPARFDDVPVVGKPVRDESLARALVRVFSLPAA